MSKTESQPAGDLDAFVRTAKARDVPDGALVALLRQNGWSERSVYRSLSAYYAELLGITLPQRSSSGDDANQAFLYLLNFITLGIWIVALGQIFCTAITRAFPDAAHPASTGWLVRDVAWQLAMVIVAFPCFVIAHRLIARDLARRPDAAGSGVRMWLTYVALVIAGLIAITDAIFFMNGFLRGELTVQFVLNTIVVVGLGGGVFAYYLGTLHAPKAER